VTRALDQLHIARGLIAEGSRAAAASHLRAALRHVDGEPGLRAEITALLAMVTRRASTSRAS
jgi:hypothetical protein